MKKNETKKSTKHKNKYSCVMCFQNLSIEYNFPSMLLAGVCTNPSCPSYAHVLIPAEIMADIENNNSKQKDKK